MIILRNKSYAVGDFLANAVEVGFLPPWFYKIYETQKFKTFFDNFDTMTTTPNYLSGEESTNWRRSHASHQRKQSVTELASSSSSWPAES